MLWTWIHFLGQWGTSIRPFSPNILCMMSENGRAIRRALYVPSVLMENIHFIGTRCWPSKCISSKQLCFLNFSSSTQIAVFHMRIRMALSYEEGTRGSLTSMYSICFIQSWCMVSTMTSFMSPPLCYMLYE